MTYIYLHAIALMSIYLFSMSNNEESPPKDDIPNTTEIKTGSLADCLAGGPLAAASRFVSSLTKQPRNDNPVEANGKNVKSSSSPSFWKTSTSRRLSTRNRSSSPISPSSDPSAHHDENPFSTHSSSNMRNSSTTPSGLNRFSKPSATAETSPIPTPETVGLDFNFNLVYKELRELAETNRDYFSKQKTDVCKRFERLLFQLAHSLELSVPIIHYLTENFHHFDYSPQVRQRSFFDGFLSILFNRFERMVIEL